MADPLSIASSVAGLVSLGLTLCGGLHNYFSAIKDRHQDIETASQSLALLQSNIVIIQSSTLKLGHRHALSANGVNQGLANCESQLTTLQQMLLDLSRDEGLSDTKGKWRKQKMIARYPFDQKRLIQLQDQLSKANVTLSSFIQSLNLDINIGIREDLQVLKNYTNANDSVTHNMLGAIARRLDTIGPAVQRPETGMTVMSRRILENRIASTSHVSDVVMKPRYLQNSQKEEKMTKSVNDLECTCSDPPPISIIRKLSYVDQSWRDMVVSKEEHRRQRHRPGCIFFSQSLQTSRTTFSYLGFRYLFSRILSLSIARDYPAGAYSLSFGIQPCNIVESSPAFQALYDLEKKRDHGIERYLRFHIREETSIMIEKLKTIYNTGAASPFDVDDKGDNIAHKCINFYRRLLLYPLSLDERRFEDVIISIRSLLSYMFDSGVPITASNFCQQTILNCLCDPYYVSALPPLYRFVEEVDKSFYAEDIAHRGTFYWKSKRAREFELLRVWDAYPEIAEAFGFNEIFRVIMQRDRKKLEAITMGDQLPAGILVADMYGRNILQASITWSEGLGLLLQQSQVVSLLLDDESATVSPLELATNSSGEICTQTDKWVLCQNCNCAVSVQILLEADCCLPVDLFLPQYLERYSLRCRKLLFEHLVDRRRRLRDLSLALLPYEVTDGYGVTVEYLPDATASFLWEELQARSGQSTNKGFEISHGIKPFRSNRYHGGLFENPLSLPTCSLANEFGIKASDEGSLGPLLARVKVLDFNQNVRRGWVFDIETSYLDWLLSHDLKLEYVTGDVQTSALHAFGGKIGRILGPCFLFPDVDPPHFQSRAGISLMTRICNSEIQSDLPCPCMSGAFNRPLASFFSGFVVNTLPIIPGRLYVIRDIQSLVGLIENTVTSVDRSYLARCAVHICTMDFLGIRHVGPCARNCSRPKSRKWVDEDEWAKILDEDKLLLEKLDDLDEIFKREFESRNESVADFIGGYYSERMLEVVNEMDTSPANDYRRGLPAAGVVLAELKQERQKSHVLDFIFISICAIAIGQALWIMYIQ